MTEEERRASEWACTRLINLYATLNDAADWPAIAALYTDDGVMTRPSAPDAPIVGRAAILAAFAARPPRRTRHVCANIVVTVDDDGAGASATSAMLLFTAADRPPLVGGFADRFRLVAGEGWRFAERRGWLDFS